MPPTEPSGGSVAGLLLAAGAGRRMGRPKALVRHEDGTPWLTRSARALLDGGCDSVTVVLGAAAVEAEELLRADPAVARARVVIADDWSAGMSASLRAGLEALQSSEATAALVQLVDLPDVGAEVVARVLGRGRADEPVQSLARAAYDGRPGHPVLLGRAHWPGITARTHGDQGARAYLADRAVTVIECGDLAGGRDQDTPRR